MKLFIAKYLLLLLLFFGMLYAMLTLLTYKKTTWLYALTDKYKRAESLNSPRLLFIGGSSLAFGLNSEAIQDSLHIPVVNMGIHADLGISFELSETDLIARKGDVVVWSFEYYPNDNEAINGDMYVKVIAYNALPEIYDYLPWQKKLEFLKLKYFYFPRLGKKELPSWLDVFREKRFLSIDTSEFSYNRKSFNEFGDVSNKLSMMGNIAGLNFIFNQHNRTEIEIMNKYAERLKERGVKIYFLFPCIAKTSYTLNKSSFDTIQNDYKRTLNVPVLNKVSEVVYPDSMFYDQVFHLNKSGRGNYTNIIIAKLKQTLN